MPAYFESDVELAALGWLRRLGYDVRFGFDLLYGEPGAERSDPGCGDVILAACLRGALERLNPDLPAEALADAFRKLTNPQGATLEMRNRSLHAMLVPGVDVEYRRSDGTIAGAKADIITFDRPDANDWLAVNQFTVIE